MGGKVTTPCARGKARDQGKHRATTITAVTPWNLQRNRMRRRALPAQDCLEAPADLSKNSSLMCLRGEGTREDHKEAYRWLRKAAESGYAEAQFELGRLYVQGLAVPQNWAEAVP